MGDHGSAGDGAGRAGAVAAGPPTPHAYGRRPETARCRLPARKPEPSSCPGKVPIVSGVRSTVHLSGIRAGGRTGLTPRGGAPDRLQLAPSHVGPRSAKRESNQAGAKQNNTGNCHSKETVGSEFFTHGTPLTARDHWSPFGTSRPDGQNDRLHCTVKRIPVDAAGFGRADDFRQHPWLSAP